MKKISECHLKQNISEEITENNINTDIETNTNVKPIPNMNRFN